MKISQPRSFTTYAAVQDGDISAGNPVPAHYSLAQLWCTLTHLSFSLYFTLHLNHILTSIVYEKFSSEEWDLLRNNTNAMVVFTCIQQKKRKYQRSTVHLLSNCWTRQI